MSSWTNYWGNCKSRLSAISRRCYLSRENWRRKCQILESSRDRYRTRLEQANACIQELRQSNKELVANARRWSRQVEQLQKASAAWGLPLGKAAPGQTYPVGLICLSVNLARVIGLRPTVRVLEIVFDWMHAPVPIPCYQSIRGWMQRIGLDRMNREEKIPDGIWVVDHTNQIGVEKVLTILRVCASRLPPRGQPLRHQDVSVLYCQPGTQWKREDVRRVYEEVAASKGPPVAILTDGAVELREPAEQLKNRRKSPIVIRDLKHVLSNQLEALLANHPKFQEFTCQASQTRSAVQQTELAHFTAPSFKQKARFMNLQPMLNWASMVLWHLEHPESKARKGIEPDRMESKLGWLRELAPHIQEWRECQMVISTLLAHFNANGVFRGAAASFHQQFAHRIRSASSRKLLDTGLACIRRVEKQLRSRQRLPISTEILESTFARYKQLEQQHAKGGFTSLLPVFATLTKPTTPHEVKCSLARVKVVHVRKWLSKNLAQTLASRRQTAYRESRHKEKTKKRATPSAVAA